MYLNYVEPELGLQTDRQGSSKRVYGAMKSMPITLNADYCCHVESSFRTASNICRCSEDGF